MGHTSKRKDRPRESLVISKQELLQLRAEWQLDVGVIEKDYVLGWVLAAIAAEPAIADHWIFKGGTCLRKCYYETYRFSEDLDFTVIQGGPEDPDELTAIFQRVASWLEQQSGIELLVEDRAFLQRRNLRGNPTQKCAHAGIAVPDADTIRASQYVDEIELEWENMLGHQLPRPLPPFAEFWNALDPIFAWLEGKQPRAALQRAEPTEDLDPDWTAPRAITSWRRSIPLETIRYAGANRLKVEIDYRAEQGRHGPRIVEPYSLRQTKDGNLVVCVINDHDQPRSYRVDRIAGVRPTTTPFTPRYVIEF
jgi:hypothetical protein